MDDAARYKREQDLIFQEIEEKEHLLNAPDEEAVKRIASYFKQKFRDDLTRMYLRKKFFRAMSKEQQEEFVDGSIREYKRRTGASI
jgi:hypothetical protein